MDDPPTTIRHAVGRLIDAHPPTASLELVFDDCGIRVQSNAAPLLDALAGYYRPFLAPAGDRPIVVTALEASPPAFAQPFTLKPPDPGKTRVKEEFLELDGGRIVRKRLTGMVFLFGGPDHLAIGPCLANVNQVINFINNRYIQWKLHRGGLLFHAAAVAGPGGVLALAGFAGAGKSTLALHLMNLGLDFVSNDRLIVRRDGASLRAGGVPKLPRVNPGTILNNPSLRRILSPDEIRRFEAMPAADLRTLEHKYDVFIDACFGNDRFRLGGPLRALVVLNWNHGAGAVEAAEVDLRLRPDLLPAFMKSTGLFYEDPPGRLAAAPGPQDYAALLESCPVIEVRGGVDFAAAAGRCIGLVAAEPPGHARP